MVTNKINNNFVIIARDSTIDSNDQMVSIFKIIDQFSFSVKKSEFDMAVSAANGKPINIPFTCVLCTSWSIDDIASKDIKLTLRYSIVAPNGEEISIGEQNTQITKGGDALRFNLNIGGFPYLGEGRYKYLFRVFDNNSKELASGFTYLRVNRTEERDTN